MIPKPPSSVLVYKDPAEVGDYLTQYKLKQIPPPCDACTKNPKGGHARWCPEYTGPHPECPECKVSIKHPDSPHRTKCSQYVHVDRLHPIDQKRLDKLKATRTAQRKANPPKGPMSNTCGCKNHLGDPKTTYPSLNAANRWSRKRWAGMAKAYTCPKGNIHLSTSGTIRVRKKY